MWVCVVTIHSHWFITCCFILISIQCWHDLWCVCVHKIDFSLQNKRNTFPFDIQFMNPFDEFEDCTRCNSTMAYKNRIDEHLELHFIQHFDAYFFPNQPITPSTCAHVLTYGQTFDAALYLSCSVKLGKTEFLAKTKQWQKVRAPNECIGKCRRNQWQWSRSTRAKVKRTRVSSWHNRQSIIINCLQRFFFLLQFAAQAKLSFMRNFPLW